MKFEEEHVYTWPNPHFPFLCLLNSKEFNIFLISNLTHNYKWFKKHGKNFRTSDFFFVSCGWNFSEYLAEQAHLMFNFLGLNKDQFFILYNSPEELATGTRFGFCGEVINNNCWLEEDNFFIHESRKRYDAFYVARAVKFKRHYLAAKIKRLALAAGDRFYGSEAAELPNCLNNPYKFLSKQEISILCGESSCGLILSAEEGACRASSEYLLSGTPVVSTKSWGGRNVWYNSENSIVCEDHEEAVKEAVNEACARDWDRKKIRSMHIDQAVKYREKFKLILTEVLMQIGYKNLSVEQILYRNNYLKHWEQNNSTIHIDNIKKYFE